MYRWWSGSLEQQWPRSLHMNSMGSSGFILSLSKSSEVGGSLSKAVCDTHIWHSLIDDEICMYTYICVKFSLYQRILHIPAVFQRLHASPHSLGNLSKSEQHGLQGIWEELLNAVLCLGNAAISISCWKTPALRHAASSLALPYTGISRYLNRMKGLAASNKLTVLTRWQNQVS